MRRSFAALLMLLLGCVMILPACDSGGDMDDGNGGGGDTNRAPNARLSAPNDVVVGDTMTFDASGSDDPDGDDLAFSWSISTPDESDVSMSGDTSVVKRVADAAGEFVPEVSVSDGNRSDTKKRTVTSKQQVPDQVTVSFENEAADADSLVAGELTLAGEAVPKASGEKSGSFTTAGSRESKQLCFVANDFFQQDCKDITPTGDLSVTLTPERKEVTVSVTPTDEDGQTIGDAQVTVYEPWRADSVVFDGKSSVNLPKRSGDREIVGDWITQEDDSDKIDRLVSSVKTVSAAENIDTEIIINQLVPACSDGIDNDGDGAVDQEEGPACTDLDGKYDPQDDNEILKRVRRVSGRAFTDSIFVSKAAEERVANIRPAINPLPWSVTVAKGEIKHRIEVQRSDSIPDQSHATHLKTGVSNDNLTVEKTSEVTADADTANGFVVIRVHGIDRSFFANGPHYAVYGWHGSKARGKPPTSGGKFHYFAELENDRSHTFSYVYEPEDVPENKATASRSVGTESATLKTGECKDVSRTDKICRVPAGKEF